MRFVSFCLHGLELVAAAPDRHDPLGPSRVALDLAANVRDVEVAGSLVSDVRAVPEVAHDLAPREDASGLAGEQGQQLQLERGQRYLLVGETCFVLGEIELELADLELGGLL